MSLGIAACGVFVLSGGLDRGGQAQAAELIGILMIIASLLGEGFFSVGGRLLVLERAGLGSLATFTRSLTWGVLLLSVIILPVHGAPDWQSFTVSRGLALLWIGPFGTAISYYIWLRLLDSVPVSVLSISLFVQPLAGIAFSCMILGESVGISRLVGGVLILAAMSIQVFGKRVSKIARS
jgi:drug/metabolite transporter (DMT)-like permease